MKVTSSNFQQSVGYYLGLADSGEEVEIIKQRPFREYILKSKPKKLKQIAKQKKNNNFYDIVKKISKNLKLGGSQEFQDKYRS